MRRFDVNALDAGLTQYWSSLDTTSNTIDPQIAGAVSGIVFSSNHVTNNRPISKGSSSSIAINSDPGVVSTDDFDDFAIGMLFQPNTSDLWIIRFEYGAEEIGVRIHDDTTIELVWIASDEEMDEDGNVTPILVDVSETLIYNEDVSYLSLSRQTNNITLTLNGQSVTIQGAPMILNDLELGGGTGQALIDKISFSTVGQTIPIRSYSELFVSQRLDTVPRPDGDSTFNYLLDAYKPEQYIVDSSSFSQAEDYFYANVRSMFDTGLWQIIKRASFAIDYSTDAGETWTALTNNTKLTATHTNILFRHQNESDELYWLDIRITTGVGIPMSYYTTEITGEVYLPAEVGTGYFDADPGDFTAASIKLTPEAGSAIRSVELLCILNDTSLSIFETNFGVIDETITAGYTLYVNGSARAFTTLKPNQIYHLVITSPTDIDWIEFNPDKNMPFELIGIGASDIEYTSSDAFYIFNTFVGNPIITALETTDPLSDGVTDSGEAATILDVQWDR